MIQVDFLLDRMHDAEHPVHDKPDIVLLDISSRKIRIIDVSYCADDTAFLDGYYIKDIEKNPCIYNIEGFLINSRVDSILNQEKNYDEVNTMVKYSPSARYLNRYHNYKRYISKAAAELYKMKRKM